MGTRRIFIVVSVFLCLSFTVAHADPILYIHDSLGNLGIVDVPTGTVNGIGNMGVVMTDIAFDPTGNLYGLSFGSLYSINPTTAASSFIGNHGIPGGNALVFGTDGTLYGAGSSSSLYTINTTTGSATSYGNMGFASAGDLAFNSGNFFLSSTTNHLIEINLAGGAVGTDVGPFGFSNVFGLATGDDGVLYGVSGSTIFSVNTSTGAGSFVSNYGGQGLGISFGSSFFKEATTVPEPTTMLLLGSGLIGLAAFRKKLSK